MTIDRIGEEARKKGDTETRRHGDPARAGRRRCVMGRPKKPLLSWLLAGLLVLLAAAARGQDMTATGGAVDLPIVAPAGVESLMVFVPADKTEVTARGLGEAQVVKATEGSVRM